MIEMLPAKGGCQPRAQRAVREGLTAAWSWLHSNPFPAPVFRAFRVLLRSIRLLSDACRLKRSGEDSPDRLGTVRKIRAHPPPLIQLSQHLRREQQVYLLPTLGQVASPHPKCTCCRPRMERCASRLIVSETYIMYVMYADLWYYGVNVLHRRWTSLECVKQKNLRLNRDQRLLLDSIRQYTGAPSETHTGAQALAALGEQLLATYLGRQAAPDRCSVLLAALNAAAGKERPEYTVDPDRRLLRWHDPSGTYRPMVAALAAWLPT